MSWPNWRQRLFGLRDADLAALRLTEARAIEIAREAALARELPVTQDAQAGAGIHAARIQWLVQFPGMRRGAATLVLVDDEHGAVTSAWRRKR